METKKTQRASLENKRVLFLEGGLIAALLLTIGAFSYSTATRKAPVLQGTGQVVDVEELIPITRETPPEPPATPVMSLSFETIEIVDDDLPTEVLLNLDDNPVDVPVYDYREDVVPDEVEEEDIPFVLVEQKPTFQGGDANTFSKWVSQHLEYPEIAKENGVSGRVMVQFTVNPNGSVARTACRGA